MEELVSLRHFLHQHPEVSGYEEETAKKIKSFIDQYSPDLVEEQVGGHGLLFVFNGHEPGKTVTIRAELDALPIQEINDFAHKSLIPGASHKCGHDGHMTILASIASYLSQNRPKTGRVILLFQPAEETGEGAQWMMQDAKMAKYNSDYIFALHNLPGLPLGKIVTRPGTFAAASKGVILELKGKTSHAAEPENGVSPALAMSEIITEWSALNHTTLQLPGLAFITVVHAQLGGASFGITPGSAKVMATFRAYRDEDLKNMEESAFLKARKIASKSNLEVKFSETEVFASTLNDKEAFEYIKKAAEINEYSFEECQDPNRWSEDFGVFTQQFKGAMFGIGAGEHLPDLHNPDYDFPNALIPMGSNMFVAIINQILNK